jgi:hypothetical protein
MKLSTLSAIHLTAAVGLAVTAFTPDADAVPINGMITFAPVASLDIPGSIHTVSGMTTVTFPAPMTVATTSGSYDSVGLGANASFMKFAFTGSGTDSDLLSAPVNVWSVGGFAFGLTNLTNTFVGSTSFSIMGEGFAYGPGDFTGTAGTFSLAGGIDGTTFTFQRTETVSGTAPVEVPDTGGTLTLLGMGVLGLEGLRRRLSLA